MLCTDRFFCCYDQTPEKKMLEEERFISGSSFRRFSPFTMMEKQKRTLSVATPLSLNLRLYLHYFPWHNGWVSLVSSFFLKMIHRHTQICSFPMFKMYLSLTKIIIKISVTRMKKITQSFGYIL